MTEHIYTAISKGAELHVSISGGKDSQAMLKMLTVHGFPIHGIVHADLGRMEWKESIFHCRLLAQEYKQDLNVVYRSDGIDLLDLWQARMIKLIGTGKPFWSSSKQRYCTSDMKRGPINKYFTATKCDFIISCEGIRAEESTERKKKHPLSIRSNSSSFYKGMSVVQAVNNFQPGKKLFLNWYPIFNFSLDDVWNTYGMNQEKLKQARHYYKQTTKMPDWWPFHPAYAYGNDRLSCVFCVLGSLSDLQNGAMHNPQLLDTLINMETVSGFTFKNKFSLTSLNRF